MNQFERAMVVVAHPDDAEFGCAGTVALWCAAGVDLTYILCTDGSKGSGDPAMTSDRLALIRRREQQAAARVLGVKQVVFLDYPDSYLVPSLELRRDIAREIRRYRPQKLICQNPVRTLSTGRGGGHPDHIAAGEATLAAVFPTARDRLTFPELLEEGLEPHHVEEVLILGTEAPDWWIDVSSSIAKVVEAIKEHKSQVGDRLQKLDQRMRESRHTVGEQHGMDFGEAFKRLVYN
jgi:LmbE family N-acetylglucosaminyl deacetylase